ncbi:MAG: acylphosphatase [Alphaproteobacteria bacterium]|nr:acylphosphatase [Alphaproteobacteria bacterium]
MANTALQLRISGKVQGVGYRDWAVKAATDLQLSGWVRNRADATVEALVAGDEAAVKEFIAQCYKGPVMAKVTAIDSKNISISEVPAGFVRKLTA